jgi:hypothetical protein
MSGPVDNSVRWTTIGSVAMLRKSPPSAAVLPANGPYQRRAAMPRLDSQVTGDLKVEAWCTQTSPGCSIMSGAERCSPPPIGAG